MDEVCEAETLLMTTARKHQRRKRSTNITTRMAPAALECQKSQMDEVSETLTMTKDWELKCKSQEDPVIEAEETMFELNDPTLAISIECFDDTMGEFAKAENELLAKLNAEIQRKVHFQQSHDERDSQHACVYKSCLQTSVEDMNEMNDEYNEMKTFVLQTNAMMDQLRKERDHLKHQVKELTNKIHGMTEQDGAIMAAVDAKVEEWKRVFSEKDVEILGYKQAIQEKDYQIRKLKDHAKRKDKNGAFTSRHRKIEELKSKLEAAESRAAVADMELKVAEAHVVEKDKALREISQRLRQYESGINGLDAAWAEIKECKNHIKDMATEKASNFVLEKELRLLQTHFQAKVEELSKVKQDQEVLLKDMLEAIWANKESGSYGGDMSIGGMGDGSSEPGFQIKSKIHQLQNVGGSGDVLSEPALQVKSQIHQLLRSNQEWRRELKLARKEAVETKELLDSAQDKIKEHDCTISETLATCKKLSEKLEEKETALLKAEQNTASKDEVINELRCQLSTAAAREHQLNDSIRLEVSQSESHRVLKLAQQTIKDLRQQLDKKQDVIKKFHKQAEQNQTEMREKYCEELEMLEQKLTSHMITSLDHFKQQAGDLVEKSAVNALPNEQVERLEETIAVQDRAIASLTEELRITTAELEQHRITMETQATKHAEETLTMESRHAGQVQVVTAENEDLRSQMVHMGKELNKLRVELESQKEVNIQASCNSQVGKLKTHVDQKEKQIKSLSKALLELRAEMTSAAERQAVVEAAQKQDNQNVQKVVDRHTQDLKVQLKELSEELEAAVKSVKAARGRENRLTQEVDCLSRELQRSHKAQRRGQVESEEREQEVHELQQQNKRLIGAFQKLQEQYGKGMTIENLQKKIRRLESELERTVIKNDRGNNPGKAKEEAVHWEEGMKWQAKINKVTYGLMEKERENETLSKELCTLKDLYSRLMQENGVLQKKLRARGMTCDRTISCST